MSLLFIREVPKVGRGWWEEGVSLLWKAENEMDIIRGGDERNLCLVPCEAGGVRGCCWIKLNLQSSFSLALSNKFT